MKLYAGIDLHSNNSYVVLLDETDKKIYQKRLPNDLDYLLNALVTGQGLATGLSGSKRFLDIALTVVVRT